MMAFQFFSNLTEVAAERVGNRNPQLLREWQGRLRWRNLLITLAISIGLQGLLLTRHLSQLPSSNNVVDWPIVWADLFRDLSFYLVWALLLGGVYLLAADLSKGARRSQLNSLRMSPQSGRQILLGKLLGVPVLMYLGVGLMLPLHLAAGLMATYPLPMLLAFYGLLGAIAFCFYAAAMWLALLTPWLKSSQTWVISGLSLGLLDLGSGSGNSSLDWSRLFHPLQFLAYWDVQGWGTGQALPFFEYKSSVLREFGQVRWFVWPVGQGGGEYLPLALVNALLLGIWFWWLLERKFQTPAKTPLGKVQSYGLTLCLSLLVMVFNVQSIGAIPDTWSYPISMLIYAVILMFLLLPSRQAVLDWARSRHHQSQGQRSGVRDLLTHDGSPAVLAVGINLAIMGGFLLLSLCINAQALGTLSSIESWVAWGFCAATLFGCALVMQWISLADFRHGRWITLGTVAALILGVPTVLGMFGLYNYDAPLKGLLLMTVFPTPTVHIPSWGTMAGAIAAHLTLISGFSILLSRRLQRLGQSE